MLSCIVCSKSMHEDDEESLDSNRCRPFSERDTSMKSLTSQINGIALRASASYKQCRPGSAAIFDPETPSFKEYATISSTPSGTGNLKPSIRFAHASFTLEDDTDANLPRVCEGENAKDAHPQHIKASSDSQQLLEASQKPVSTYQFSGSEDGRLEWVAQVEPGVLITFVALPDGGNELRRIKFNRKMFDKQQVEVWWTQNSERVHELYNVRLKDKSEGSLRSITCSNEVKSHDEFKASITGTVLGEVINSFQSRTSNPQPQAVNCKATNAPASVIPSENDSESVKEDAPGVFVTVKIMPGGNKALKRVRFSCEKFNEQQAKEWWEKNRLRIHEQYLRKQLANV